MKNIDTIAFDANDTLWVNQTYFDETEYRFRELLEEHPNLVRIDKITEILPYLIR